ncbi:hypothetical protein [Sphingopyxis sp. C-1]|uniref:hypothetical protein n=1 Tax=Sphingopyxis sp. C-1 TaxID=262667 RepID=UPI000785F6A9|nr:hypothetical protein [Sphingopyxis sp. C-1]
MSARWFRFYADAMRHPKVAKLPDQTFRLWVELLCVAAENDGHIPPADDLKHMLKRRLDHLLRGLQDLLKASLIDPLEVGYRPHGWDKRQYKSDVSTDRVRKHRTKGNVSETAPDTEAETELPIPNGIGAAPDADKLFWENAKAYLAPHSKDPGKQIGKWIKDCGGDKAAVARAIGEAQVNRVVDPVSYISRLIHRQKEGNDGKVDAFWG